MTSPLLGSIAKTIGSAFKTLFYPATLVRSTAGGGDAWNPSAPSTQSYSCLGIHDEWDASLIKGGLVGAADRKVLILATSLAIEPKPLDQITIRGTTLTVVPADTGGQPAVSTDPAIAVWVLRCSA